MEKLEKSIIAPVAIAALLFATSLAPILNARAEDNNGGTDKSQIIQQGNNENSDKKIGEQANEIGKPDNENEIEKQKQEIEEAEQDEADLHEHVDSIDVKANITLPEVDADKIVTYQDAVSVLKSFQDALNQIKSVSDIKTGLDVSLNDKEKILLDKLLSKHKGDFGSLDARISELNGQIQELIDLLSPLADQPISSSFRIKKLLISEIKGLRNQINKLTELENLDIDEIDEEIS